MNYARIVDDIAVDVSTDPEQHFHHALACDFIEVPDEVRPGWRLNAGEWQAPQDLEPAPLPQVTYPAVGPIHFKMLFAVQERLKAKELRATDPVLDDFWGLVEDPRTDMVNLALQSVQAAVEYTLSAVQAAGIEVDVPARKAEILAGVLR